MNKQDHNYLKGLKEKYPKSFKGCKVLELGSGIINGSVRGYFEDNKEYVGVDFRKYAINDEGDLTLIAGVDLVARCIDTDFAKGHFDTIISYSMIEHDTVWKDSLSHNIPALKKGGMLFLEWGGIGMGAHGLDYGGYHPVSVKELVAHLESLGMKALDIIHTEGEKYPKVNAIKL